MSKFEELVENILNEYWTKSGNYTNDPQDEYDGEDEYYNWLENQDFREGFAVFIKKDKDGRDLFAAADKSVPEEPEYYATTDIMGDDPELPDVFKSPEEAQAFAQEWKQHHPNENVEVTKVYAQDEEGYEYFRTKQEVYPFENWDYTEWLADEKASAADDFRKYGME